jgi:hypothetical protein
VKLLLLHPGLTRFTCAECQQFSYDFETGERDTFLGAEGTRLDVIRSVPPPCEKCPKQSPEREREHVLSAKNLQTMVLYRQVQATSGACLTARERRDSVLVNNLAVVDGVVKACEKILDARKQREQMHELVALARVM